MTVYDFHAKTIDGDDVSLEKYKGDALLIVNVASKCGFTPQYKALEQIYEKYMPQGFAVLGFPSNQFGAQEPGTEEEIKSFCTLNYAVRFPMFARIDVNGANAHPLYQFLTSEKRGILGSAGIKWNFTKFLVDREGHPIKRYAPQAKPEDISSDIEAVLQRN